MDQRRSGGGVRSLEHPRREPIRTPWLWVVLAVIVLAGVPLYLPPGSVHPLVFGVLPAWLAISVVSTLLFAGFTAWVCLRRWNLAEPEEEAGSGEDRGVA